MLKRFFEDEELQSEYEKRVKTYISTFTLLFKNYIPEFHDDIVGDLIRTQMMIERWEKMIYHDQENRGILTLIENDRKHYNQLLDKMMIFLKSMETKKAEETKSIIDKLNKINEKFLKVIELFNIVLNDVNEKNRDKYTEMLNAIINPE